MAETTQNLDRELAKRIVEANVTFYENSAAHYDAFHGCMKSRTQERYAGEIGSVLARLNTGQRAPRVLDVATGTGSLAFIFAERGCKVVGLDVSETMLRLLREKLKERKLDTAIELVKAEVDDFLSQAGEKFDVIAFGSALHHFAYYADIVGKAAGRVQPGGAIYIGLEPAKVPGPVRRRANRALCRLDYVAALLIRDPKRFAATVLGKLFCRKTSGANQTNTGKLAEYHAMSGVDLREIVQELKRRGMATVEVTHRYGGKYALIRACKRLLVRVPDEFSVSAFKNAGT